MSAHPSEGLIDALKQVVEFEKQAVEFDLRDAVAGLLAQHTVGCTCQLCDRWRLVNEALGGAR